MPIVLTSSLLFSCGLICARVCCWSALSTALFVLMQGLWAVDAQAGMQVGNAPRRVLVVHLSFARTFGLVLIFVLCGACCLGACWSKARHRDEIFHCAVGLCSRLQMVCAHVARVYGRTCTNTLSSPCQSSVTGRFPGTACAFCCARSLPLGCPVHSRCGCAFCCPWHASMGQRVPILWCTPA